MEFSDIVKARYATKKFTGESLSEDKIAQLKELIKLSASSFGLQSYKVIIIKDQATKEKLLPLSYNQPQITTCSHLFVFCANTQAKQRIDEYGELMKNAGVPEEKIQEATTMMHQTLDAQTPEQLSFWAQKQVYIALSNGLNGAKSLGFDSCPMEGFDKEAYKKTLNLPNHLLPTVIMPVGIAADTPHPKLRFDDLFDER